MSATDKDGDLLNVKKLRAELEELIEAKEEREAQPEEERAEVDEDDEERLTFLQELFKALGSDETDYLTPEHAWEAHCREEAEEQLKGVSEQLVYCIDWEKWAGVCASDTNRIQVQGVIYYYT